MKKILLIIISLFAIITLTGCTTNRIGEKTPHKIINILLDIPMILLLNKIGFPPYLGSLFATMIGLTISELIVAISLRKEFKFKSYKEILDLIRTYEDIVLIGEVNNLDYFRSNGVTCISINDKLEEYNNVVILEKNDWSNEIKYNLYSRTLNDLIIYDMSEIPDGINDLDII